VPHISTVKPSRRRCITHTKTGALRVHLCDFMCETTLRCAVDKMFEVDILCRHKKWLQKCRHNSGCKTVDINVRCRHQLYQTYVDIKCQHKCRHMSIAISYSEIVLRKQSDFVWARGKGVRRISEAPPHRTMAILMSKLREIQRSPLFSRGHNIVPNLSFSQEIWGFGIWILGLNILTRTPTFLVSPRLFLKNKRCESSFRPPTIPSSYKLNTLASPFLSIPSLHKFVKVVKINTGCSPAILFFQTAAGKENSSDVFLFSFSAVCTYFMYNVENLSS